ncbi:uncharacterized protein LOC134834857 isoform X2 [Culicoides brevitarsis]|uniref:uncharacterized protein LOC134834857 isoform X2 n=1 Tax=Culicoides brevitarsis TaxID=469753 RepID=UPI00307CBFCA
MTKLDADLEKSCLEEISHLVLDSGKKKNKVHAGKIDCSYAVQYQDENGNPVVGMLSYDKLKCVKVNKSNKNLKETLFGIVQTSENRSLGLQEHFDNIDIPIKAKFGLRNAIERPTPVVSEPKIHIKSEKVTSSGTKNISNMFAAKEKPKEVKKEEPKKTPVKKESPPKKESPKKATKPAAKGNISSFFSKGAAKPSTSVKQEPPKTPKEEPNTSKNKLIDSDDDEVIDGTPQEKRVRTKKIVQSAKHSRIAVLEDSSESENEEEKDRKRAEREIEANVSEEEKEEEKKKSPEKPKTEETSTTTGGKRKAYRQVVRKYQDADGFLVTRKEKEEYFVSDEEDGPAEKKQKSEEKPKTEAPKPAAKTKQKNIMSFFTKK